MIRTGLGVRVLKPSQGEPIEEVLSLARQSGLRARLAARDERALVELIELATPWVLGLVQSMLHDQDEAEEPGLAAVVEATELDAVVKLGGAGGGRI